MNNVPSGLEGITTHFITQVWQQAKFLVHSKWTTNTFYWTVNSRPRVNVHQLTMTQQIRLDESQNIQHTLSQGQADKWRHAYTNVSCCRVQMLNGHHHCGVDTDMKEWHFEGEPSTDSHQFVLPTVHLSSWALSNDVSRVHRPKLSWRGSRQSRTHHDHEEEIRSPWLLNVIRSVCDAG